MFEMCQNCPKLPNDCCGPNFFACTPDELIAWCKGRKRVMGLTNAMISEMANIALGTVDGLLSSQHNDFRFSTIQPILKVLIGGEFQGRPCPEPTSGERAEYEATIEMLKKELEHSHEKNLQLQQTMCSLMERHAKNQEFMRTDSKQKNRILVIAAVACSASILLAIAAILLSLLL